MIKDDAVDTDSQTLVRKKEVERSKENRKLIKSLLEEINHCVSDGKLNRNSTLETAVATLKLNSFYKYNARNSYCPSPVSVDDILKSTNSVALGVGFLESGIILYATDQLIDCFKDTKNLSGHHLSKICSNSSQILNRVFNEKENDFVLCMINSKPKMVSDIYIKGKHMTNKEDEIMYLGYTKIDWQCKVLKNPSRSKVGCYLVTNPKTMTIEAGNSYLNFLLNTKMVGTLAAKYPHPDMMEGFAKNLMLLKKTGFINQFEARMLSFEADGSAKCLHAIVRINLFRNVQGETRIAHMLIPYAITEDQDERFSVDDIKLLNDNPTTAADIKLHTRLFKKAVINREGIFGDSSKTKTIRNTDHGKPKLGDKGKARRNSANVQQQQHNNVIRVGYASQNNSYPSQVQDSFFSNSVVPQASCSQTLPNQVPTTQVPANQIPTSQIYDIILHQPILKERVLVRNVVATSLVLPQAVEFDPDSDMECVQINVVD